MSRSETSVVVAATNIPEPPAQIQRPARYDRKNTRPPTVSVVIPTYNERENIVTLVGRLGEVLVDFDYEIIVVDDDSPDGTSQAVGTLAENDHRLRLVRRVGRRGLSSAVIDGMTVAQGQVLVVMDADLQHDEAVVPDLISAVVDDGFDVCLGSREAPGGGYGRFGPVRRSVSWTGAQAAHQLLGLKVSDPMSGFFAVSQARFNTVRPTINPRGFKIMLEVLARGPQPTIAEVGYEFRSRTWGETKLSPLVIITYLLALAELSLARTRATATTSFLLYAALALVALSIRTILIDAAVGIGLGSLGAVAAVEATILAEGWGHNRLSFAARHRRSRGRRRPFLVFHLVAAAGAAALSGLGHILGTMWVPSSVGTALAAIGFATTGVLAVIGVGYCVNAVLGWPPQLVQAPDNPGPGA